MSRAGGKAVIADGDARHDKANPPTAYGGYTNKFIDRLYAMAALKLVDVFLLDLGIVGFWYNTTLFDQAGIDAPPATWTELLADVQTLKDAGITPIAVAGGDKWPAMFWYAMLAVRARLPRRWLGRSGRASSERRQQPGGLSSDGSLGSRDNAGQWPRSRRERRTRMVRVPRC